MGHSELITMVLRRSAYLALVIFVASSRVPANAQEGEVQRGRELTAWLLGGNTDSLQAVMSPQFLQALGGRSGLTRLVGQLATRAGAEVSDVEETAFREGGLTTYYRVSRFERLPSVTARWIWKDDDAVVGSTVTPTPSPAPSGYLDYQTKSPLRLPFSAPPGGMWYVAWGGRDPIHNYHVIAPDQRFAYDFVVVRGDSLHRAFGSRNEDYYCWGERVYAPAEGRIVTVVDSVTDNARPGEMNERVPPGNHVVIDHGNGEFSMLAHFQRGSVVVGEGEGLGRHA